MPVDVASGAFELELADVQIAGVVPLTWDRKYSSSWLERPPSPLGAGWICQYYSTLTITDTGFDLFTPTGTARFDGDPDEVLRGSNRLIDYGSFSELYRSGRRLIVQRWGIKSGSVWRYCFPVGGPGQTLRLASIENASGDGLDVQWDGRGRLAGVRQRVEGGTLQVQHDANDRIELLRFVAPSGNRHDLTRYEYNGAGRLAAVYDAAGFADRYETDDSGRIRRQLVKDGGIFTYLYDRAGRCVRTGALDGYDTKVIKYFDLAGYSEVTDSYANTSIYRYNAAGQILEEVNPLGARQTREFDAHGRPIVKTDANGAVTRYEYDANGDRTKVVDALGQEYGFTFNADHLLAAIVAPDGRSWTRSYNDLNRMVESRDPTGGVWQVEYDADGRVSVITDPVGFRKEQRFAGGRLVQRSDAEGHWSSYVYDDFGQLTREIDAAGHRYEFAYDSTSNLVEMVRPDGSRTSMEYNPGGTPARFVDQEGFTIEYTYGPCRRLLEYRDRVGETVRYRWGTEPGRLEAVINQKGESFDLTWDAAGELIRTRSFDGVESTFEHDPAGYTVKTINGAGEVQELTRNLLGQLLRRQLSTGGVHTFEYDALGHIVKATSNDHVVEVVHDPLERVVKEIQDDRWVVSEYDGAGNARRIASSYGDDIAYSFDGNRDVRQVSFGGRDLLTFSRDAVGLEVARDLPAGVRLTQSYDVRGLLQSQTLARRDMTPVVHREFTLDARGLLRFAADDQLGPTQYDYDPEARLTGVSHGDTERRWQHDPAGNIVDLQIRDRAGTRSPDHVYGPGNRLLRAATTAYEYDGAGRVSRKIEEVDSPTPRVWQYRWDAQSVLTAVVNPDGQEWRYTYDAFGRRLSKSGPTGGSIFVWNKFFLLHEITRAGRSRRTWIMEPASFKPLAQVTDGRVQSIITNPVGTPRELVDEFGAVTRLSATDLPSADASHRRLCPLGFEGQFFDDESGLYYNTFRYYDPAAERFISPDPRRLRGGLNLYVYPRNPLWQTDPLGLDSGVLDRALGGKPDDGLQAHHIIPEKVMNDNQDMIDAATNHGFQRDGKDNGIHLPSADDVTKRPAGYGVGSGKENLPSHRGSHPKYNKAVGDDLDELRGRWGPPNGMSDEEMAAELKAIQDKWRKKIEDDDVDDYKSDKFPCKLG